MRTLAFLLLCLASAAVPVSCGQEEERGRHGAADKAVPEEAPPAGEVPVTRDFSFIAGVRLELPRGFPDDIALYPGAKLRMSQNISPDELVVVLATADDPSRVESWYRERLAEQGWQSTREAELDDRRYVRFEKEGRVATVTLDPEEEETIFSLIVTSGSGDL